MNSCCFHDGWCVARCSKNESACHGALREPSRLLVLTHRHRTRNQDAGPPVPAACRTERSLPTALDGQEMISTFNRGGQSIEIRSCEVAVDPEVSPFRELTNALFAR